MKILDNLSPYKCYVSNKGLPKRNAFHPPSLSSYNSSLSERVFEHDTILILGYKMITWKWKWRLPFHIGKGRYCQTPRSKRCRVPLEIEIFNLKNNIRMEKWKDVKRKSRTIMGRKYVMHCCSSPLALVKGKEIREEGANSKLENLGETSNIL